MRQSVIAQRNAKLPNFYVSWFWSEFVHPDFKRRAMSQALGPRVSGRDVKRTVQTLNLSMSADCGNSSPSGGVSYVVESLNLLSACLNLTSWRMPTWGSQWGITPILGVPLQWNMRFTHHCCLDLPEERGWNVCPLPMYCGVHKKCMRVLVSLCLRQRRRYQPLTQFSG